MKGDVPMNKYFFDIINNSSNLSIEDIILRITVSALIGLVIYVSYKLSHNGTVYSKKFNVTLVTLTILTATVMTVIGNNIALSLGMVGALSIVRFRTAIKDSRDTAYIFWTIVVGICCGVGDYVVASIGSTVIFTVLLLLGRIKSDNRILLVIRGSRELEQSIQKEVFEYYNQNLQLRVKNTTRDSVEFIYELSKKNSDKVDKNERSISDILYALGNVEYVNVVTQNDEIA